VEHPYTRLVEQEAKRVEDDLAAFRSRALTVVTTSSGVITLLTAVATFASSRAEKENGLSGGILLLVGLSLLLFVVAATLALMANAPGTCEKPSGDALRNLTSPDSGEWASEPDQQERKVAKVNVTYLISVRVIAERSANFLFLAIAFQIGGLVLAAIAGLVAANTM
jgi:hypothetical protein